MEKRRGVLIFLGVATIVGLVVAVQQLGLEVTEQLIGTIGGAIGVIIALLSLLSPEQNRASGPAGTNEASTAGNTNHGTNTLLKRLPRRWALVSAVTMVSLTAATVLLVRQRDEPRPDPTPLDVFVRSSDSSVQHRHWNGSTWQWENLGGKTLGDPAGIASGSRWDVFMVGVDYRLYVNTRKPGQSWSGWRQLSSTEFKSSPSVTKRYGNGIDIAIIKDHRLHHGYYNLSTDEVTFADLGGVLKTTPAILASPTGDRLTVFAAGPNDNLQYLMWTRPKNRWGTWVDLGVTTPAGARLGATTRGGYAVDLFYRDNTDKSLVYWHSKDGIAWNPSDRADLGGNVEGCIDAYAAGSTRIDVFSRKSDGSLIQKYWVAGRGWSSWAEPVPIPSSSN